VRAQSRPVSDGRPTSDPSIRIEEAEYERGNRPDLWDDGGTGDGGYETRLRRQDLLLLRTQLREGVRPQTGGLCRYDALGVTEATASPRLTTVVLDVSGLYYATEKNVVETVIGRRPGVHRVEANPVAQTATVTYDPAVA